MLKSSYFKIILSTVILFYFSITAVSCLAQYTPEVGDKVIISLTTAQRVELFATASDSSAPVGKLIYGDTFEVLEKNDNWLKIKVAPDRGGWLYYDPENCSYELVKMETSTSLKKTLEDFREEKDSTPFLFIGKIIKVDSNIVTIECGQIPVPVGKTREVYRQLGKDKKTIGKVKILKREQEGTVVAQITEEKGDFEITVNDFLKCQQPSPVYNYLSLGKLDDGAYKHFGYFEQFSRKVPYQIHYPQDAEILNLGFSGFRSKTFQGNLNFGFPLRNLRLTTTTSDETRTRHLKLTSMIFDFGVMCYPLNLMKSNLTFQPFLQCGLGGYIVTDRWWKIPGTILIFVLFMDDDDEESEDEEEPPDEDAGKSDEDKFISNGIDIDFHFFYGGGIDFYLSKKMGFRLSVKKHRCNLPDLSGALDPLEISVGFLFMP